MTLQQFEYIIAVDKLRSFTKAADYCRVTQPTLSAMIQKLEDELEVKIFDRTQQPIAPTAVGAIIIKQAHEVLAQTGHIKELIAEERNSFSGVFRLGILPTIAPYLLPRFVAQLTRKYPQLDIRMSEMKTSQIKEALMSGDIDAGILADIDGLEEYHLTSLFYEQFSFGQKRNTHIRTCRRTTLASRRGTLFQRPNGAFLPNQIGTSKPNRI